MMKNILLAVVGLSPQVITETLYALHQQGRRVDAVEIITTRQGKEAINALLLAPGDGRYHRYLADYGIDTTKINFDFDNIHTVADENGIEIDDITNEEENEMLLRRCLELTFRLTRDEGTAVFFSIAGGRKTMSACLMHAAQLYGRPQDRIYHVLVSPEFESNRNFFYPPRESVAVELRDRDNQPYSKESRYARVTLVPIPFFSVREQLTGELLREPKDPATLMMNLIREEPFLLTVDLAAGKLICRKRETDMMPARLALYAFFALNKKDCPRLSHPDDLSAPSNHSPVNRQVLLRTPHPPDDLPAPPNNSPPLAGGDSSPKNSPPPAGGEKGEGDTSPLPISCRGCADCYLDFSGIADRQEEITSLYRRIREGCVTDEMSDTGILGLTAENFNSYKGKIRKDLERGFGPYTAARLNIEAIGNRPDTRYGLGIDREKIRVVF